MNFIREIEFRIKFRELSADDKIRMFFEYFNTCQNISDEDIDMIDIINLSSIDDPEVESV